MGQIIRCPLVGTPCMKPITIQEKTFFLAEAEEPDYDKKHRSKAINEAIADGYKIRSALEEKGINAFNCKICEMIQTCAYGIADITQRNPNVLLELGMMIALGKPTIILLKKEQDKELKLFSDLKAIEVIPFEEYLDIIEQLRKVVGTLPPAVSAPKPIEDLEKLKPKFAEEIRGMEANIVKEFKESIEQAKLDTISLGEEKKEIPPELSERLKGLEEKLDEMRGLGFMTDAGTAFLRGNYFYNQGKYEEALASYNWSLEVEPNTPGTLNNRGITYGELEKHEEALADYNRSLEIRPDDPTTLNNRGIIYRHFKKHEEALADYNRSLEIQPDDPSTLHNRGITYDELERYEEALADYNRSLEIRPDDPDTLNSRGVTYANLQRYDDAHAEYSHALKLKPDYALTNYNLACLSSILGKTDDALTYLEKAIDKDKKYLEMHKTDKDFANICDDPRFKKLIESD